MSLATSVIMGICLHTQAPYDGCRALEASLKGQLSEGYQKVNDFESKVINDVPETLRLAAQIYIAIDTKTVYFTLYSKSFW